MAKYQCPKCGYIFEGPATECPKCKVPFYTDELKKSLTFGNTTLTKNVSPVSKEKYKYK